MLLLRFSKLLAAALFVTYMILSHAELHLSHFCIYSQYNCVDVIVRHTHRGKVQKVDKMTVPKIFSKKAPPKSTF